MSTNNLGLTLEQSVKYQGRLGQWAWIFHRLSGLGVLLFLTMHIIDTSWVYFARSMYAETLKLYKSIPFGIGELLLQWELDREVLLDVFRQGGPGSIDTFVVAIL